MDTAPFARDLCFVDVAGAELPPFLWNDEERRARLVALFFWLDGIGADDAQYILSPFPIVREQDPALLATTALTKTFWRCYVRWHDRVYCLEPLGRCAAACQTVTFAIVLIAACARFDWALSTFYHG